MNNLQKNRLEIMEYPVRSPYGWEVVITDDSFFVSRIFQDKQELEQFLDFVEIRLGPGHARVWYRQGTV